MLRVYAIGHTLGTPCIEAAVLNETVEAYCNSIQAMLIPDTFYTYDDAWYCPILIL